LGEAVIMYGKPVAEAIEARVLAAVPDFVARHHVTPTLAIVQVGSDAPSGRYIRKKIEAAARLGMRAEHHPFPEEISADALKEEVERVGRSPRVHGVLIQLPLPRHIEEPGSGTNKFDIFDVIPPEKDVDGIGRHAVADLYRAQQDRMMFLAATALAVRRVMAFYRIETEGRRAVVIGRNDITAKPVVHMLGGRMCNAAAIWCHRHVPPETQAELLRSADIVVTSVGSAAFRITADMLKPGVAVFDVATRVENGKLKGDVDFKGALQVASHITPVPGGIGPVTVAALSENLLRAAQFACGVGQPGYTF
jgi:5,10-methylene-tetrahydrofolate dehydrogenase/methenyl tetrahydrofolate cyclohydrolase